MKVAVYSNTLKVNCLSKTKYSEQTFDLYVVNNENNFTKFLDEIADYGIDYEMIVRDLENKLEEIGFNDYEIKLFVYPGGEWEIIVLSSKKH